VAAGRGRSRRVSLPGVAELLRPAAPGPDGGDRRRASGREKHTQKITVYLSAEELLDLERARLALLRYGAPADRGRIVREAIAVLLADLDARGQDSLLARRIASENRASENRASENRASENRASENHPSGGRISENGTSHSSVTGNGVSGDGLPPGFVTRTMRTIRIIRTRVSAS
jgi:hypothetical protein